MNRINRGKQISIVAEEGTVLPPIKLWTLQRPASIEMRIASGPSRFLDRGRITDISKHKSAAVVTPMIAVQEGISSELEITIDGEVAADLIRIGSNKTGDLEQLLAMGWPETVFLELGPKQRYVVIDEEELEKHLRSTPSAKIGTGDEFPPR